MIPGYLTAADVAARIGVKPATVRQYLHRGNMPKEDTKAGQSPLWKEATIEAWLESRPSASWKKP